MSALLFQLPGSIELLFVLVALVFGLGSAVVWLGLTLPRFASG